MNAPIFSVGGNKGGVGKSKIAFALIDYLIAQEKKVLRLETDTSNPDVFKTHHPRKNDNMVCNVSALDVSEGWIELVNVADEFPKHIVVINSAARSNTGIEKYGEMLRETLGDLNRERTTFWVVNRQRYSVELLRGYLNVFPDALIHVCRNLYFGAAEKFALYNESKAREIIERKGLTLDFSDLDDPDACRHAAQQIVHMRKRLEVIRAFLILAWELKEPLIKSLFGGPCPPPSWQGSHSPRRGLGRQPQKENNLVFP